MTAFTMPVPWAWTTIFPVKLDSLSPPINSFPKRLQRGVKHFVLTDLGLGILSIDPHLQSNEERSQTVVFLAHADL